MLINLLPDFFAILDSTDRIAAYRSYFEGHRRLLQAYWHNYVIDPDSPHFTDIVRSTVNASRGDLSTMLERTDERLGSNRARCRLCSPFWPTAAPPAVTCSATRSRTGNQV